jgi:capsid protein
MFAEHFARIWEFVIERQIPGPKPGDWRKVRFTPPRAINVDVGRNSAALISEFEAGFKTLEEIAAQEGKDWKEVMRQRAKEIAYAASLGITIGQPKPEPPKPTA